MRHVKGGASGNKKQVQPDRSSMYRLPHRAPPPPTCSSTISLFLDITWLISLSRFHLCPECFVQFGVSSPEIVAATTAHAAIEKACDLMEIRLIKVRICAVEKLNMIHHTIGKCLRAVAGSRSSRPCWCILALLCPVLACCALPERPTVVSTATGCAR